MATIIQTPPNVVIDPIMDINLGPMPLWLIIIIILLMFLLLVNAWWLIKWFIMAPVKGAGTASKATGIKTQQAFMFSKNRSFSIQALEYIDGVLSYKDPVQVSKWMLTSPTSVGKIGFKPVLIASDNFDCIRDPVAEMAVCRICKEVNQNNEKIQINNYSDFMEILPAIENAYPEGVPIPVYALYSPDEVQKYTPKNRSAGMFGSMLLRMSRKLNLSIPQQGILEKYLPFILFVSAGVLMMAFTYMFVSGTVKV